MFPSVYRPLTMQSRDHFCCLVRGRQFCYSTHKQTISGLCDLYLQLAMGLGVCWIHIVQVCVCVCVCVAVCSCVCYLCVDVCVESHSIYTFMQVCVCVCVCVWAACFIFFSLCLYFHRSQEEKLLFVFEKRRPL